MHWFLYVIILIMVFITAFISYMYWFADKKKIYQITWRYDELCSPTTELIKGKDPYDAWRRLKRQHAFDIDLMEIKEYV